jgi:GNAT superfamily N-acetyltransferase
MPSLFAQYVKEREGKHVIETEDGFAVLQFFPKNQEIYIEDIYVIPEKRKSGIGRSFLEQVEAMCREQGFNKISGSVRPSATGSTDSLKVLLSVGFRLAAAESDAIFFIKEVV